MWTALGLILNRLTILLVVAFMQVQSIARVIIESLRRWLYEPRVLPQE
jgi:hypothetical protein